MIRNINDTEICVADREGHPKFWVISAPSAYLVAATRWTAGLDAFLADHHTDGYSDEAPSQAEALMQLAGRVQQWQWEPMSDKTHATWMRRMLTEAAGVHADHAHYTFIITGLSYQAMHDLDALHATVPFAGVCQLVPNAEDLAFVIPAATARSEPLRALWYNSVEAAYDAFTVAHETLLEAARATGKPPGLSGFQSAGEAFSFLLACTEVRCMLTVSGMKLRHLILSANASHNPELVALSCRLFAAAVDHSPNLFADFTLDASGEKIARLKP